MADLPVADEQGEMPMLAVVFAGRTLDGDLGAEDRAHRGVQGGHRELHRAGQRVVIGQCEGRVTELGGPAEQLLRQRGAVQERVGGVSVKLGIGRRGAAVARRHALADLRSVTVRPPSITRSVP